jgi:hypothetical protein
MPTITLDPVDVQNAQIGINLPLIYGFVRGQGNEILNHSLGSKNKVIIRILCEGEIDGIERLFINSALANAADTTLIHFHPGIDATLGTGLTPVSTGGDQGVDAFWSLLPANFQPTTFSRKAYMMLNVPPDPAAPSDTVTIVTDLRGCRVRQFDGSGNQTGYGFSTNGAEQVLDLILRTVLKPEWNTAAAAAGGGDLTTAEKARIDWPSYASSVAWCNAVLSNGQKRFESSVAFVNAISLNDALTQLLQMSQLYITEARGRIFILPDQPRASTFLLTKDHIVPGTASFDKINLHGANNRYIGNFNDLNAQGMVDIDTPANNALVRNGAGLVTVLFKTAHPFSVNQNVQITPPQDGSVHDIGFDGVFGAASLPAANKITYLQSGNANWFLHSEEFDNAVWVKQTGITVTANNATDPIGGNSADTVVATTASELLGQISALAVVSGVKFTFSIWLRCTSGTMTVALQIGSAPVGNIAGGSDAEISSNITVTTVWQRFSFTHSGAWTLTSDFVYGGVRFVGAATVIAWGAQIEDGSAATTYRQTTTSTSGVISGNGTAGTPESRFAQRTVIVNHEQHQQAIGQRGLGLTPIFRVSPVTLDLGNNTWERVNRILNFLLARNLGLQQTPYNAPFTCQVTAFMDAVDVSTGVPRALISQLAGDTITIDATVSEEYQGDYEIKQAVYTLPGSDDSSNSDPQSNAATIALTLLQYLPAAFSDFVVPGQSLRASAPAHVLPIGIVDPNGILRLAGAFKNNPISTSGTLTGNNPLSQSGTTTTILVAAFTVQFGDGQVSYNSGSVNPGSLGQWGVYCIDPNFTGGSVVFFATQSTHIKTSNNGIIFVGTITTSGGGGAVGSGGGAGSGDGFGGGGALLTR